MDLLQFGGFRLANACVGHNRSSSPALVVALLKHTATSKPQFARQRLHSTTNKKYTTLLCNYFHPRSSH